MLGEIDPNKKKVFITGGGIAGLLCAYRMDQLGFEVTLCEAEDRMGGLIRTMKNHYGLFEGAAHSILTTPLFIEFAREIGLELLPLRKNSRSRFIWRDGRMSRFPLKPRELFGLAARLFFYRSDQPEGQEMTLEQWSLSHLGPAALEYLMVPMLRGVYGSHPGDVDLDAAFPKLRIPPGTTLFGYGMKRGLDMLRHRKEKPRKARRNENEKGIQVPRYGMESLVSNLQTILEKRIGSRLMLNHPVSPEELQLRAEDSNVILAVPAKKAAALITQEAPELAENLRKLRYSPIVCATLFVENRFLKKPLRGVGVLIPEREPRKCMGVLFNSSSFEGRIWNEDKHSSYTMMLGGSRHPEYLSMDETSLRNLIEEEARLILGLNGPLAAVELYCWQEAIPIYDYHLKTVWKSARSTWCNRPGRMIFSNYTAQVSIRGMAEQILCISPKSVVS